MTIALVVVSLITVASLATIASLVVYLMRTIGAEHEQMQAALFAGKAQLAAEQERDTVQRERDDFAKRLAESELTEAKAVRAYHSLQRQLTQIMEKETENVVDAIRNAPDAAAAAALLRDSLSTPVPGMPPADGDFTDEDATTPRGDSAEAGPVSAPAVAEDTGFGRGTGW